MKSYLLFGFIFLSISAALPLNSQCVITPVITPSGIVLCPYSSDTLRLTQIYDTYQWYENGSPIVGATDSVLPVSNAGFNYTVFVTADTCSGMSANVLVDGWLFPYPLLSNSIPVDACTGQTNVLTLYMPYVATQWYLNNIPIPNSATNIISCTQSGTYSVDAYPGVCPSYVMTPAMSLALTFTSPPIPVISPSGNLLATTILQGVTYQWSLSNNMIVGATSSTYQPTIPGVYTLTITDVNGCSSTSAPFSWLDVRDAGEELYIVSVADGIFTIELPAITEKQMMRVYDFSGRIVTEKQIAAGSTLFQLDLSQQPEGVYLFILESNNGRISSVRVKR